MHPSGRQGLRLLPALPWLLLLLLLITGATAAAAAAVAAGGGDAAAKPAPEPRAGAGPGAASEAEAVPAADAARPEKPSPAAAATTTTTPAEATTLALDSAALETENDSPKEDPNEPSTEPVTPSTEADQPAPGRLPLYRLLGSEGETCILLEMDAVVGVFYETKSKEMRDLEEYVDEVQPSGTCGENEAQLTIAWKAFTLRWSFTKTGGGDGWYVNNVELKYDKSDSLFENASSVGVVTLSSERSHGSSLFATPVGKSFHCTSETTLQLTPKRPATDSATLLLRHFRIQPFMFKDYFAPAYECRPGGGPKYRDETAPIAVGSTLAIVVLLTVSGYGVYRYFKIKKVQYDTME